MQSSNVTASSQDQRCGSALDAAVRSRLNSFETWDTTFWVHTCGYLCILLRIGLCRRLDLPDRWRHCFPGNCCWRSQFPYVATGWKGRKGCGVLYSVRDRMAGSKMSAVFTRRQGVLQCFVASGAFCQQGIIQAVLLSSQGRERGSEIFFFIHSLPMAGRQVVQWDKRPIYVPNGKLMLLGNSEHVQRMAFKPRDILDS